MNKPTLAACLALCLTPLAVWATRYDYDALNRVTKVTYDNGFSISYAYDTAGNITSVTSEGRCSAVLPGTLGPHGGSDRYSFEGLHGEPVTLRLEAIPKEGGIGKFARLKLLNKKVVSALPTELTAVLPQAGTFVVQVKDTEDDSDSDSDSDSEPDNPYVGPYQLTLEASPVACATFSPRPDDH